MENKQKISNIHWITILSKIIRIALVLITFQMIMMTALAQEPPKSNAPIIPKPIQPGPTEEEQEKQGRKYFSESFIPFFTKSFIQISGIVAVIFMSIAGVQFLTAYGNEEKLGEAKKSATYAALGFLVALLSYAIISILNYIQIFDETG